MFPVITACSSGRTRCRAAVTVDRIVFNQHFARVIGIGVEDNAFAVRDFAGAVRRNQLSVIIDEVSAYDVVGRQKAVSEFSEVDIEIPLLPNADQFALLWTTLFKIWT